MSKRQDPVYQAMNILARRDHSRAEVVLKLKRKGFTEQEIAKAVEYLQEKRFLDDTRFAKTFIESILRAKPVGPRYLSLKLKQKGVGESLIQEALQENYPQEGEIVAQAAQSWQRLHPKHASDRARLYRFLASRGFTSGAIAGSVLPPGGE